MTTSQKFFNREASVLEFNARVLSEAMDTTNPLLERLKFIGIVSSNLDEFFMVRMASLSEDDPYRPFIQKKVGELFDQMNNYFAQQIILELEASNITRIKNQSLTSTQMTYIKRLYDKEIEPILTPLAISDERSFPTLNHLKIHIIVNLVHHEKHDPKIALIEVPSNIPRMIHLPESTGYQFILLEDLISIFLPRLFIGHEVTEIGLMRITRGAELTLDEENDQDFMKTMSSALKQRRNADIMRLEYQASASNIEFLKQKLNLKNHNTYHNTAWLDLKGISQLAFQPGFDHLKRPNWEPLPSHEFENYENIWDTLKQTNIMLLHPYTSFDAVTQFIEKAARDENVLAIKQTLYRANTDSNIIRSLEKAAEKGKQVTVLVELKARFDEEKNIEWAKRLQLAGASIIYGVVGLKTHAKACLIVRREPNGIHRYVHLSTGNYNEKTARLYSDIGFFTGDEKITSDIAALFNIITGYSDPIAWSKIEMAPYGLRKKLLRLIQRETLRSSKEKPGLILIKLNSLVDPELIEALYQASKAHVEIKLNVRGICCLKPGVKDLSENIEVISIVDMFLEHSRILYFQNGGDDEIYLSSADWMPRNLDRRIEILFPVEDKDNKKDLIELLEYYFKDNAKAWKLELDGSYQKISPDSKKKFRIQEFLCRKALQAEENYKKSLPKEIIPQRPQP